MSVYRDDVPVPRTFFEAAALHWSVKIHCSQCANKGIFDPAGVWWRFHRKGWNDHFHHARRHFYCVGCAIGGRPRVRPSFMEAVKDKPVHFLEQPSDREWKRAASRFRM